MPRHIDIISSHPRGQRRGKLIYYSTADQHVSRVITDMLELVAEPHPHDE